MDTNGWNEYKIHVLNEITELKAEQKQHAEDTKQIMGMLAEIKAEMRGFKASQKWEVRILSAVWGLIVLGINAMIGSK